MPIFRKTILSLALLAASCNCRPCLAGYLTLKDLAKINNNRSDYEWGAEAGGIPWTVLAAIHYRESDLRRIPGNIGGAFMLDCGGETGSEFERRLREHEAKIAYKYAYRKHLFHNPSVEDDFRFACLVAADELQSKVRGHLYLRRLNVVDEDVLADALWGYNGRSPTQAKPGWKYSPCVANNPKHGWMLEVRWTDRKGVLHTYMDMQRPGTLVIYRELERLVASGSTMLQ